MERICRICECTGTICRELPDGRRQQKVTIDGVVQYGNPLGPIDRCDIYQMYHMKAYPPGEIQFIENT